MAKHQHDATYVAQTIRAFLDGSGGEYDWDHFTSCSLRDPHLDDIRRRAGRVEPPCGPEETAQLEALATEAERRRYV
jgi:hypothetical protein